MKTVSVPSLMIADLEIISPFRVYDTRSGNYIFSWLDTSAPGDIPPDIACLPVIGLRAVVSGNRPVLYIDTIDYSIPEVL